MIIVAALAFLVVASAEATAQSKPAGALTTVAGGITRADVSKKEIRLVFTGHEFADGGDSIRRVLHTHRIKASFFFTGDFYRNDRFSELIAGLKHDDHYLGAHSDRHLLYCSWEKRDSLLVSKEVFRNDLLANYREMERFGILRNNARFFLPPYEWYNDSISAWTRELGFILVNFTPGTTSNADWTHPELGPQYVSSDTIYARIMRYEAAAPHGLNGFLLLTHIGTDPRRRDKFYLRLGELILQLKEKGYRFVTLSDVSD